MIATGLISHALHTLDKLTWYNWSFLLLRTASADRRSSQTRGIPSDIGYSAQWRPSWPSTSAVSYPLQESDSPQQGLLIGTVSMRNPANNKKYRASFIQNPEAQATHCCCLSLWHCMEYHSIPGIHTDGALMYVTGRIQTTLSPTTVNNPKGGELSDLFSPRHTTDAAQ